MANMQYTTEQLARRFIDQREVQNVMGQYMMALMICRQADIVERFWSKKAPDPVLGRNNGWYQGLEAIDGYYRAVSDGIMASSRLMAELFPEKLGGKSEEEIFGAGTMTPRPLTTPVVEIAGDGQTAKGLWQVMGCDSEITERGPISNWKWGWAGADLVLEDGEWKVWHLQLLDDLVAPVGTDWTRENPYPVLDEFRALKRLAPPAPTREETVYEAYSRERPFTQPPAFPVPYDTFSETFSYGI